ncbi:MAG: hypothetical protein ACYDA3_07895 [Gaiellaceae bacterium]
MNESTPTAPFGYMEEPPVSPSATRRLPLPPPLQLDPQAESAPPAPDAPHAETEERPSVDAHLRCYRLLTDQQIAQALREGTVNDKSVLTIALEQGWIDQDDIAPVDTFSAPPPEPTRETTATEAALFLRLANGERILVDRFATRELANAEGRHLSFRMGHEREWPLIDGRFVSPEAVVSLDVEAL